MFMRFVFVVVAVLWATAARAGMFGVPYSAGIADRYVKGVERFLVPVDFQAQESLDVQVLPSDAGSGWNVECPVGSEQDWVSAGPQGLCIDTVEGGQASVRYALAGNVDFSVGFSLRADFQVSSITAEQNQVVLLFGVCDSEAGSQVQVFAHAGGLCVSHADDFVDLSFDWCGRQEFRLVVKDTGWKLFAGYEVLFNGQVSSGAGADEISFGEVNADAGQNAVCTWYGFEFALADFGFFNRFGLKAQKVCVDGYEAVDFEVVQDIAIGFAGAQPDPAPNSWCGVYLYLGGDGPSLFFSYAPPTDTNGILRVAWVRIGQTPNELLYSRWIGDLCLHESGKAVMDVSDPVADRWFEIDVEEFIPPVDCLMLASFGAQTDQGYDVYMHIGAKGLMPVVCGSGSSALIPVEDGRVLSRIEGSPTRAWLFAGGYFDRL